MLELISETNYRETMENTVEPKLASIREELSLPLEDGGALHAELYEQPTATRAVVVLHGYTESGEKFREMTWYFLQSRTYTANSFNARTKSPRCPLYLPRRF